MVGVRMMKKLFFLVLMFVAASVSAASPKVFRFNSGSEPQTLDPQLATTVDASNLAQQIFEGLVSPDPKEMKVLPGVAEKWEISPDGKIYTFHLRKNAKWSDGKPVTAYDFEYAWERGANPKTASTQASRFHFIKNGQLYNSGKLKDPKQLGFKAVDPLTFRVELEAPFPPFLELCTTATFLPVRKDVVEKFGDKWTRVENIISNGPFMLNSWRPYEKLVLVKNPNYWDAKNVQIDEIVAYTIEDLETALKRYQAGDLDFIDNIPQLKVMSLSKSPEYRSAPLFGVYYYPVNVKHPVLKDARIRKALSFAIDREALVNQVLRTGQKPATGIIPPGVPGYNYSKLVTFDPAKAKQLVAEAGYPDGKGFPVLTLSYNTMESHKLIAETIQQMWKKNLGIDIKLLNQEWKVHVAAIHNHNYDIARFGGIGEYVYPTTTLEQFATGNPGNDTQWSNVRFDKLWGEAAKEANLQKRLKLYEEMEKIVAEESPEIPLYFYAIFTMTKPNVKGLYLKPDHGYAYKHLQLAN